ncbi:MAG: EAL domain-containing protein [Methylotenera sp.]
MDKNMFNIIRTLMNDSTDINSNVFNHLEEEIYKEKARAAIALNSISDAVICTDTNGDIDYLNIAAEKITGWSREEANGHPISKVFKIINGVTHKPIQSPVDLVLQSNKPKGLAADTILITRDGKELAIEDSASPIHNWEGKLTGVVIVFHDVSVAKELRLKMTHLAQHDFLTDLPNRVLLNDRISQAIALAMRSGTQLAVLFLDLDNFKYINDSLGHETGDKVLQSIAKRLNGCVRSSDTISRLGGDEFVILLREDKNGEDAALTAEKILASMILPLSINKNDLYITTSIGISIYPADGLDAETLIKNADTAMYDVKKNGSNNYRFFKSKMNIRAAERQFIEANLRLALENKEFTLHYQPKVNLNSGKITGVEALIRWEHPEWGEVMPEKFISVADDCGLIMPIGRWVLREACTQAKLWIQAGLQPVAVAVNISAKEFHQNSFVEYVRNILCDTNLEARYLELEITESSLMSDAESSIKILSDLKKLGLKIAVDDFGTGYSSLNYLKKFPIDVLKIDQSFVHDINNENESDNGIIVSAIINMGNSLNLRVIAEGVENHLQLNFLKFHHCDESQGYLFSKPLMAEQFTALLLNRSTHWCSNFAPECS